VEKNNTPQKRLLFIGIHHWVLVILAIVTFLVYWQVTTHDFINFDDDKYITNNHHVNSGISLKNIYWAFTTFYASNWHPLTWLSHMVDCQLFGLNPGMHHLINLIFHVLNALLLFVVFRKMTGELWKSAFVAALFSLHPLHVESVAWVAERKDVLSTFFFMLTLIAYVRYVESPSIKRYLPVILLFALGLLAKPMLVTLPFVLLFLDYWPLHRYRWRQQHETGVLLHRKSIMELVREKIPLFVLTAASCIVTYLAQSTGGAVKSFEILPFNIRFLNAIVSYMAYIYKMLWPKGLAILYPYSFNYALWQIAGSLLLLVCIFIIAIWTSKNHPFVLTGWLWYIVTLVPVIGIIQVGSQSMADRYTYIPLIGIFFTIAWGVPEIVKQWRYKNVWLSIVSVTVLLLLSTVSFSQIKYWADSFTVFNHALNVTQYNHVAHAKLGDLFFEEKNEDSIEKSIDHYSKALLFKPDYVFAHTNIGIALVKKGRIDDAIEHYRKAISLKSDYAEAHTNLGLALVEKSQTEDAVSHYYTALQINPDAAETHYNLGIALAGKGEIAKAIEHYSKALQLNPEYSQAHTNMGIVLSKQGNIDKAISHYLKALELNPDSAETHSNLGISLVEKGKIAEAIAHYNQAVFINPNSAKTYTNLGNALLVHGQLDQAIANYKKALELKPSSPEILNNMGSAILHQGKLDNAISYFQKAIEIQPDFQQANENLNKALEKKETINKTIVSINNAIRLYPKNYDLHFKLGNIYNSLGTLDAAEKQYLKTLELQPEFILALNNLSQVYINEKAYDKALPLLEKIIKIQPQSILAHYNMTCLHAKQNHIEEAINWLEKAVNAGFNNWEVLKHDPDLNTIRHTEYYKKLELEIGK
jgi:tetratricopeptide (TPR) repeat protein